MNSKRVIHGSVIFIPLFLIGLGTIMIYSSSSIFAAQKFHDSAYFLKKQILWSVLGMGAMFIMMKIPYGFLKKLAYPLWVTSLILLAAVLVPGIGTKVGGAVRWLRFGPLSFQPGEFAKLAVIILMAYSLSKKDNSKIKEFSIGVLPHLIFVLPVCLLIILQPDFGTSMMLVSLLFVMLFVAGVPAKFMMAIGSISSVGAALLISCKGYRLERLMTFVDPWKNASDSGFQIVQSFLAFGAGGVFGTGLGKGTQKLFYLPEPHTDFILSVIGEELGFFGVMCVIILFLMFIICGIKIAIHASDLFGTYLAVGIIFLMGLQTVTNMGVVMGLLPTKGIPLPFVSYGGTSLLINLAGAGILLSISAQGNYRIKR